MCILLTFILPPSSLKDKLCVGRDQDRVAHIYTPGAQNSVALNIYLLNG